MREVLGAVDEPRVVRPTVSLWHVIVVAAAAGFVTLLIMSSGHLSPAWLLYLAPITLAALVADVPGGIVVTALCAGAAVLVAPPDTLAAQWPELATGLGVFLGCAVVVGAQAHRQKSHTEALERVSTLDPLTGVRKAVAFQDRLSEEMRRSDRYGTDVGVVVARVEDVENFTRTFGRYKTDLLFKHLADVMRLEVRDTDSIGRMDHALFALILPHSDAANTAAVAARVAEMVAATDFEGDALEPVTSCRIAVASSSYPEDAGDAQTLMTVLASRLGNGSSPAPDQATTPLATGQLERTMS